MMLFPEPPSQYRSLQDKKSRRRLLFWLIAAAFFVLLLAILFLFPEEPPDTAAADATATAFVATATAFAETFLATRDAAPPVATLTLPEVEATSTRLFEQLRTEQPLLFPPEPTAVPAP